MSCDLESLPNRDLAEEIEAINAIYDADTIAVDSVRSDKSPDNAPQTLDLGSANHQTTNTTIRLQIPNHPSLSFVIGFDEKYPETPPRVVGTASTASRGEGRIAVDVLEDIISRTHQPGQVCLFEVISEASEKFEELSIGVADDEIKNESNPGGNDRGNGDAEDGFQGSFATMSLRDAFGIDSAPEWILSDVVTEKKSVFVGRAVHATSRAQAQAYLDHLVATDKKVAAATHNISAWRIREKKDDNSETTVQDCDDDGETAAGGRLLHMMQLMDVWDVLVVVTRWYGGVLLGPDRFRFINNAGKDALAKAGFQKEASGAKDKGKKKGKK